jgi:hypothetical protein
LYYELVSASLEMGWETTDVRKCGIVVSCSGLEGQHCGPNCAFAAATAMTAFIDAAYRYLS